MSLPADPAPVNGAEVRFMQADGDWWISLYDLVGVLSTAEMYLVDSDGAEAAVFGRLRDDLLAAFEAAIP